MRLLLLLSALFSALAGLGSPAYAAAVPAHQVAVVESVKAACASAAATLGRPAQSPPTRTAILFIGQDRVQLVADKPIIADRLRV